MEILIITLLLLILVAMVVYSTYRDLSNKRHIIMAIAAELDDICEELPPDHQRKADLKEVAFILRRL